MKNKPNLFSDKSKISVIIVNYRSWKHLTNCLNSLVSIVTDTFLMEVIVVDNFSNDGLFKKYQQKYPTVNFIKNSGNNGFANGCNLGAKNGTGNYFLFLNPDTIVSENPISEMLNLAKKQYDFGIISCEQKNAKGSVEKQVRMFPRLLLLFGFSRAIFMVMNRSKIEDKFHKSKKIIFPDWVSGSVIFIGKSWFEKVGGWNEDYWMYSEDIDLCKRISEIGGKIALTRASYIIHNHGGASRLNSKTSALTKTEVLISSHVYIQSHFKGISKYFAQIIVVISLLISKSILAVLGLIFFFIPKLKMNYFIGINLIKYYISAITCRSWLSVRSMNNN